MKRRIALVFTAVALVLAGCGGAPDHGQVIGKRYNAPYSYSSLSCFGWSTYYSSWTKSYHTQCSLWLPVTHHVGPRWFLDLKTSQHQGYHQVPESDYQTFTVGQQYG